MKTATASLLACFTLLSSLAFAADDKVQIDADTTEMKGNIAHATGHVVITHPKAKLQADKAVYDPATKEIALDGNVQIDHANGDTLKATSAVYSVLTGGVKVNGPHTNIIRDKE